MRRIFPFYFIALLFFSAPALAQQPRIDSIAVDEDKGELVLHGNFQNSSSAVVLVDSAPLPIVTASDTLMRATIPDSGKGSAGWVSMTVNGSQSNKKLLTYFHIEVSNSWRHYYGDGTAEIEYVDNLIHIRFDVLALGGVGSYSMLPSRLSKYHISAAGSNGIHGGTYHGSHYDSTVTLTRPIVYDARKKQFLFYYWMPSYTDTTQSSLNATITLDSNWSVTHYHSQSDPGNNGCNDPSLQGYCTDIDSLSPTNFPPGSSESVHQILSPSAILSMQLSSNPVGSNTSLAVVLRARKESRIEIMDIIGHVIISEEKLLAAGLNELPINSSSLPPGIYICRIEAGGEVLSIRFVKD
ncbi:MAG: T9SS type A sorting domain-containing protein [Bacteroidota bacterium]|nr:T9SS type A sorting domain-containing protein [Bacteroidota bacterium]MDP4231539.1 T9SS type A sorting domain-containing protein [Bacteroidota bacterium]MDP4236195.1 T9SS type A sorting domain-containing protein [Bacteroidota bacterium]